MNEAVSSCKYGDAEPGEWDWYAPGACLATRGSGLPLAASAGRLVRPNELRSGVSCGEWPMELGGGEPRGGEAFRFRPEPGSLVAMSLGPWVM